MAVPFEQQVLQQALGSGADISVTNPLPVNVTPVGVAVTYQAPTFATVGVAEAEAVAANANRKIVVLINDSVNTIWLAVGAAAVVGSGIRLNANGGGVAFGGQGGLPLTLAAIRAIAAGAGSNLTVQEAI